MLLQRIDHGPILDEHVFSRPEVFVHHDIGFCNLSKASLHKAAHASVAHIKKDLHVVLAMRWSNNRQIESILSAVKIFQADDLPINPETHGVDRTISVELQHLHVGADSRHEPSVTFGGRVLGSDVVY